MQFVLQFIALTMILCEQVMFKGQLVLTVLSLVSSTLLSISSWHHFSVRLMRLIGVLSLMGAVPVMWQFVLDHLAFVLAMYGLTCILSVQLRLDTALEV